MTYITNGENEANDAYKILTFSTLFEYVNKVGFDPLRPLILIIFLE